MDGPLTALLRGEEDDGPQTAQELLLEKKYAEEEDALLLPRGRWTGRGRRGGAGGGRGRDSARKAAAARRAAELTRAEACYSGEPVSLRLEGSASRSNRRGARRRGRRGPQGATLLKSR